MPKKATAENRKEAVSVRLQSGLINRAKEKARAENRTFTNFLETVLESHLRRLPEKAAKTPSILD